LAGLLASPVALGDAYWATERDEPASVTIITAEEIARYGYLSLEEALQHVRGFTSSTDYYYAHIGARGLAIPDDRGRRMLVMVDGESSHEYVFGGVTIEPGLTIPMESLERIEIIRGPGSARYGTGALAIVVNLVTKTGQRLAGLKARVTQFGAAGTEALVSLGNARRSGLAWSLSVSKHRRSDEVPALSADFAPGADLNIDEGHHVSGQASWRSLRLVVETGLREKRVPTAPFNSALGEHFTILDQRSRVSLRGDHTFLPQLTVSGTAFGSYYESEIESTSRARGRDYTSTGTDLGLGVASEAVWTPGAAYSLRAGGEGRRHPEQTYSIYGGLISSSTSMWHGALYADQEIGLTPHLTLATGLRYDYYYMEEHTESLNPRLALVYSPLASTSFKALYSSSFRVPSIYENRVRAQAQALDPERMRTAEVVWMQRWAPRVSSSLSAYTSWLDGLIATPAGQSSLFAQYANRAEAQLNGIEMDVRYLGARYGAYAQLALQHTRDRTADEPLPGAPSAIAQAGGHLDVGAGGVAIQVVGHTSVIGYEAATASKGWWMAHGTYNSPLFFERYQATVQVRNALDARWETPAGPSVRFEALPQPGRQVRLSIRATL
jgi:iron complex outermembrane receptor protein